MSLLRLAIGGTCGSLSKFLGNSATHSSYCISAAKFSNFSTQPPNSNKRDNEVDEEAEERDSFRPERAFPATKDRTVKVEADTSIRYMRSDAFKQTYGKHLVWQLYRRNHKGAFAPKRTRLDCIKNNEIATGSPCPICRDPHLILHHTNLALLHHFISKHSGEVLTYDKTGLCQRAHRELVIAVDRAVDLGLVQLPVPFRLFNYKEYYPWLKDQN